MKKYKVWISDPLTVNKLYFHLKPGVRIMSEAGKKYRGDWRKMPVRKSFEDMKADYEANHGKVNMIVRDDDIFIEGRLGQLFRKAKIPAFKHGTKVVIEAKAIWKDHVLRDMSNLQKPIEDAFQDGGFIKNDAYILWRNMDFKVNAGAEENLLELSIYGLEEGR
jgi:hypothetical protein